MSNTELFDLRSIDDDPTAPIWRGLAVVRREVARACLSVPPQHVQGALAGDLGKFHRIVLESGIKDQLTTQADQKVMEQISQYLRNPKSLTLGPLLAAMLFFHPHQLGLVIPPEQIPEFMLEYYLRFTFAAPVVLTREGEADAYAHYVTDWLRLLFEKVKAHHTDAAWQKIANEAAVQAKLFTTYFSNANLREVMSSRARLIEQSLKFNRHEIDFTFPRRPDRRIRLGVLAGHFMPKSETFATLPLYRHLDRNQFEIILIATAQQGMAPERYCASFADQFIALPAQLTQQVQTVRAMDLDMVWIATNITAVAHAVTALAAHRLARMQISSVCSCSTSGMKNIDYYVSGRLSEPRAGAQDHYSEKLLLIDGPAHCYDFSCDTDAAPSASSLSRTELNIDPTATIFASGANFYKILPELENAWARILAAVPGSRLILYPFNPYWSSTYPVRPFLQRMKASFARHGVALDRLAILLQAPDRSQILACLALADIYLDSFPFAGATSLLDPLQRGIPCVAMDGITFRSLVGAALLRDLGLDEFVARSAEEYVKMCVKLAIDTNYRADARRRFTESMARGPRFLDGKWYAREIERVLIEAWNSQAR